MNAALEFERLKTANNNLIDFNINKRANKSLQQSSGRRTNNINLANYINNNKDVGTRWTKEQGASPEAKEQEETSTNSHGSDRGIKLMNQNPMCHSTAGVTSKQAGGVGGDGGLSYSYSYSSEQLGTKVEIVYNLLSMLGTHDRAEMTSTLLAMSSSPDSCRAMRQSGCLSLLVQLVHSSGESNVVRERAAQALRNMVLCHGDDRRGRREARVLRLLDEIIAYTDSLQDDPQSHQEEGHPNTAIAGLMKLSFDEEHRLAMCQLGALYVVARLVQVESDFKLDCCMTVKRLAGMALTNLTFGDGNNKALLCSMKPFMATLVAQLSSSSEDLVQVTASVFRNVSWRADGNSKQVLREVGSVPALMKAAMSATREPTLKAVLSALWNLSAHCNLNKADICAVDGALKYLVEMLNYQSATKTVAVVENAGGILRNVSNQIATREDYRKILREENCLAILLCQLTSPSLTVVSNACGTLWNLSSYCATDQRALLALGAVPMLTSLAHSRHRLIAMSATAALKNLLPVRQAQATYQAASSGGATLSARKRRVLEAELNSSSLSETCDNIEPCPNWDLERETAIPQAKESTDQINNSMKQLTLEETTEQPVNYSLKYCEAETKVNEAENDNDAVNYSIKFKEAQVKDGKGFHGNSCYPEEVTVESDYAETDLDQLTDYSLRYNEEEQLEPSSNPNKCEEMEEKCDEPAEAGNSVEASPGKFLGDAGKGGNLETPLMFSRCSSLGSVGSIEQQDEIQSVVSEFSRMTSGIMSPSELPDSPTQTVPPSPRVKTQPPPLLAAPAEKDKLPGIFEDSVKAFKEESTPAQFSTATSLSDLTFDDEPHDGGALEKREPELAAVSEEEDENAVLARVINIGMQNNTRSPAEPPTGPQASRLPKLGGIPVKASLRSSQPLETEIPTEFCTEGTPASLSHAASHSELSLPLSDGSSDNILAECIISGMPQISDKSSEKKASKAPPKVALVKPCPVSRMRQLVTEDEVSVFATEGSPGNFSIRSSLSDLTINSKPERNGIATPPPPVAENPSPLSSLGIEGEEVEAVTVLSGTSADDVTLADQDDDQALLAQLISSGMPSVGDKMKESCDTWAEDVGEMSLPSLSLPTDLGHPEDDLTLTESRLVPLEAGKIGFISNLDMETSFIADTQPPSIMASILSLSSVSSSYNPPPPIHPSSPPPLDFKLNDSSYQDLENVQPPSGMDSILSSTYSVGNGGVLPEDPPEGERSLIWDTEPPEIWDRLHEISALSLDDTPPQDKRVALLKEKKEPRYSFGGMNLDGSLIMDQSPPPGFFEISYLDHSSFCMDSPKPETPPAQRRASPKGRRELGGFRYNTYVIRGEKKNLNSTIVIEDGGQRGDNWEGGAGQGGGGQLDGDGGDDGRGRDGGGEEEEGGDEGEGGQPSPRVVRRITPRQRRQADKERFQTRTISDLPPNLDRLSSEESCSLENEVEAPESLPNVDDPPRPIVVKPPEVKTIRGGGVRAIPAPRTTVQRPSMAPVQRQGTFTKDEVTSFIPIPVRKVASSTPKRKIPVYGANKGTGNCSSSGRGRAASLPNKSRSGIGGGVRPSSSNQNLKSAAASGSSSTEPNTRSASNASLNSQPSTSRVAALWKKVDEAKKKQPTKDNRVWVKPDTNKEAA